MSSASRTLRLAVLLLSTVFTVANLTAQEARPPLSPARLYGPFVGELERELARAEPGRATLPGLLTRYAALERRLAAAPESPERDALVRRFAALAPRLGWRSPGRQAAKDGLLAGGIGGTVRARATGEPIAEVQLILFDELGAFQAATASDAAGHYLFSGLAPGDYRLVAEGAGGGYANVAYPDVFCGRLCDPLAGAVLNVEGGVTAADFALVVQGHLRGTVVDGRDGSPVSFSFAWIYDALWNQSAVAPVENGVFTTSGLEPGSYFLYIRSSGDLAPQFYDGIPCLWSFFEGFACNRTLARPIAIPAETEVAVEVRLAPGASVSGRITDDGTGQQLLGATFRLLSVSFTELDQDAEVGPDGSYLLEGLPPGSYRGKAERAGFTTELYRALPCVQPCGYPLSTLAMPLELAEAQHLQNVDFALRRPGNLAGVVRDRKTGLPIEGAAIAAYRGDLAPFFEPPRITSSGPTGDFGLSPTPAIEYFVFASAAGYVPLGGDPEGWEDDPTRGERVTVPPGGQANLQILLTPLARLEVRLLNRPAGGASCSIEVWERDAGGTPRRVADDSCAGDMGSFLLPGPGPYYVGARGDFAPTFLGLGPCYLTSDTNYCDLSGATPILLAPGASQTVDLPLIAGSRIDAEVRHAVSGEALPVRLLVVDSAGRTVRDIRADFENPLEVLPPGRYYLAALGAPQYQNVAYPEVECSRFVCDPRQGQPLDLVSGRNAFVPFELEPLRDPGTCSENAEKICVQQDRFEIVAEWKDFQAAQGHGKLLPLGSESGYSYFFSPSNVELMVKVLNACSPALGEHFWVFAAGLTNVEVRIVVRDTWTGQEKVYDNPLGRTFPPILDIAAFATCGAPEPAPVPEAVAPAAKAAEPPPLDPRADYCTPGSFYCLAGRYEPTVIFTRPDGSRSAASGTTLTPDTKAYTFFSNSNYELLIKALDACDRNGRYWFFAAGLTDVPVEIRLLDLATQETHIFTSPGGPFQPIFDLQSLPCATGSP